MIYGIVRLCFCCLASKVGVPCCLASLGSRSGNPAAAGSVDAAASATGGDMFACIAQNQGPNSTYPPGGGVAIESVCKVQAQKTCEQNRRTAIAIRCNRRELWQFGADGNSQVGRQHISRIKQVQMAQKSRVGMPVT